MPQEFVLTKDDRTIRKTIYLASDLDIEDGDPIMVDGELRQGLQEWKTITVTLDWAQLRQYTRIPPRDKKKGSFVRWSVYAWLKIESTGARLEQTNLRWELAEPGWEPDDEGNVREGDNSHQLLRTDMLLSQDYLPFVQRNQGGRAPPSQASTSRPPPSPPPPPADMRHLTDMWDEEEKDLDDTGNYEEPKKKKRKSTRM